MTHEELNLIFNKYLRRNPTDQEYGIYGHKIYNVFEQEILNCKEYIELTRTNNCKTAILLSGHIRKFPLLDFLKANPQIHVFAHLWDTIGNKGNETNLDIANEINNVQDALHQIPNLKGYIIENNNEFIKTLTPAKQKYFNYSSDEIYIKSQLYSIKKSYELFEKYYTKNKTKYDIVIKSRCDLKINEFNISQRLLDDINNNSIIFVPNAGCAHEHTRGGWTGCLICNQIYYVDGYKFVHIEPHSNIICDIFAYGSAKSMKDYCSMYDFYDKINDSFFESNMKSIKEKQLPFTEYEHNIKLNYSDVFENHYKSVYYLNCSFPERIIQEHLRNYMLVSSTDIKMSLYR